MRLFVLTVFGAMFFSSVFAVAQEAEKPWAWITTCATISETPIVLFEEKSAAGSEFHGFDQYLLLVDTKTGGNTYKFLLSGDILCTMMHRAVYESRR